ncbi:MAG TPA: isochorismatase [Thermoanaerobaculia bacterium]|nr:isochorismatase [Thermoanaerobaculia bacterium]
MAEITGALPIPDHFDPDRVGEVWRVEYAGLAAAARRWAQEHGVRPAEADERRLCLLLVDVQNTFCIPGYELFVAGRSGRGAVEDNVRLCRFLYRNLGAVTVVRATLDTHTPFQIFHPAFWIDEQGEHPEALTAIRVEDVERGHWRVDPRAAQSLGYDARDELDAYALHYVRRLAEAGKYDLMIWPYHALLGGPSHALVSAVHEAVFFHSIARSCETRYEIKGDRPLTEHYSALRPEVTRDHRGRRIAAENAQLVETLLEYDAVVVAGQAKSHCLAWTIEDLLGDIRERDPELARKVYLLEDCTSPVVIPGAVDFTEEADRAFARFAEAGVHVVRSTDSLADWAGF